MDLVNILRDTSSGWLIFQGTVQGHLHLPKYQASFLFTNQNPKMKLTRRRWIILNHEYVLMVAS